MRLRDLHANGAKLTAIAAERGLHGLAAGRKNWLFAGSDAGGRYAASAFTLIEIAKLNGVDPLAWITVVFGRIAEHKINRVNELLPWCYQSHL